MSYIIQSDLKGKIPEAFLVQALDDNGDGQEDIGIWDTIASDIQKAIDGVLGAVYTVPFAVPLPDIVLEAAKVYACEALYRRRGFVDINNPWAKQASDMRARLKEIVESNNADAIPGLTRTAPAPILISEPAKTTVTSGRILA
jgi:phage gp36-like protein